MKGKGVYYDCPIVCREWGISQKGVDTKIYGKTVIEKKLSRLQL